MPGANPERVDWVDYAKGFCIVMVVMMHSTLGVEKAAGDIGWMNAVVEFARPFRMPDFFLIAGLFLARTINRDWTTYLDRKVAHFFYFYALWLTIQFVFKAPGMAAELGPGGLVQFYLFSYIEPFGTMWFIYLLPVFFLVTRLSRPLPAWLVLAVGAALEILHVNTGWTMVDEFASRFVYFFAGYLMSRHVFQVAAWAKANVSAAVLGLVVWATVNATLVLLGWSTLPFVSLGLGFVGANAVVVGAALLSRSDLMAPLRYCGRHSIVIYLAFFLPMATTRVVLLKLGFISDLGAISLLVTAAGVIGPLLLFWAVRSTPFRFLFDRPQWARLQPARSYLVPAE